MILLLLGLCIVLFDANLAAGNAYIGIFPDMLGYAMIFMALKKANVSSPAHEKLAKWAKISVLISAAVYIAALAGIVQLLEGWLWIALDLGSFALECYVAYLIVAMMKERDPSVKGDYGKKLISFWRVSVLFGAVAFCCIISPASTMLLMGFSAVADISLLSFALKNSKRCAFI
jgi:archaellum biogenesis protein FlaJ (TadC family)